MDKALEKIRRLEEENQHLNQTCVKARKRVEDLELENKKVHQDAESMRRSKDGKINALRNEFMTVENDKNDVINELTRRLTKAEEDNNDKLADALKKITVLKEDNAIIKSQTTSKRFGHMIEMPIDTTKRLTISKKTIISPTYGTSSEKYKKNL
mmetsp:Transcript_23458/g.28673  ORF Transcript_23458/g.28673 Transcript_23458/m.28673 type:complete len:154 (-) Transcript_23458:6-467(-)